MIFYRRNGCRHPSWKIVYHGHVGNAKKNSIQYTRAILKCKSCPKTKNILIDGALSLGAVEEYFEDYLR